MVQVQGEWSNYLLPRHYRMDFPPGALVLDVGCGSGKILRALSQDRCAVLGVDIHREYLIACRDSSLSVCQGRSEALPVKTACFDGVVCRVVMPYTDEALTLREIDRVLRPGGLGYLSYHGLGYYLRYLFLGQTWKWRLYGLRTLVNTWFYVATGRRLHGFWGDTIYQSRRRLAQYYKGYGLLLLEEETGKKFWSFPVFIYHTVKKRHPYLRSNAHLILGKSTSTDATVEDHEKAVFKDVAKEVNHPPDIRKQKQPADRHRGRSMFASMTGGDERLAGHQISSCINPQAAPARQTENPR